MRSLLGALTRRAFLTRSGMLGLGLGLSGASLLGAGPRAPLRADAGGRRVLVEDLRVDFVAAARQTSATLTAQQPFTHVGLHWQGPPDVAAELRTSADGQAWDAWQRLWVERRPGETVHADETFAALVDAPRHRFLQYRFGAPGAIGRVTATCLNSLDGPRLGPALAGLADVIDALGATPALAGGADFRTGIITREQWEADESLRFKDGQEVWPRAYVAPRIAVVHHTAGSNDYQDPAAVVRSIYAYHAITQGWGDIGYNALIDRDGRIYEGRRGRDVDPFGQFPRDVLSFGVVAGHTLTFNYGSLGISLLGNFMEVEPADAMLTRLEDILAYELARHQIDPRTALDFARSTRLWRYDVPAMPGHRDCNTTECPGDNVYKRLPDLRERLARRLDAPPQPLAAITTSPAPRNLWPGRGDYGWQGVAPYDCVFEGFQRELSQDPADNFEGYDALTMPKHVVTSQRQVSFKLLHPGQYTLHLRPANSPFADRRTVLVDRHVVVDNADPQVERQGEWTRSREILEFHGSDYELAAAGADARFRWTLVPPEAGSFVVQACWSAAPDRSKAAPFRFGRAGEPGQAKTMDQTIGGTNWQQLGTLDLAAGQACWVELAAAPDGVVVADATRIVLQG